MKTPQPTTAAALLTVAGLLLAATLVSQAGAQVPEDWILFGHDIRTARIITIDTTTGLARPIGPLGFGGSSGTGMEASRAPVTVQGGLVYPAGTMFGVIRDNAFDKDYVVVVDNRTGQVTKSVELDLAVSGRGVGFGPDGKSLYVYYPPGVLYQVDTLTGALTFIGDVVDERGIHLSGVSLGYDPVSGDFLALAGSGWNTLIRIDPTDATATVIGELPGMRACSITRSPGPVAGPQGTVFPEGTWFAVNTNTRILHAITVDTVANRIIENREIGPLGPNASFVCATAFSLPVAPWVTPSPTAVPPYPGPPGYPGETPATPLPATSTATPAVSPTPVALTPTPPGSPAPGATNTPATASCVCPEVRKRVPQVVIQDALANPGRYYGWRYRLDMGKPPGPGNPLRECLSLQNVGIDYHPIWNKPIWRVGCP